MYSYQNDEIDFWKRKALGLPPRKEIILPPDSLKTPSEVAETALSILNKKLKGTTNAS